MRRFATPALVLAWGLVTAGAPEASASPPPAKEWEVEIAPYGWLALTHGQIDTPLGREEFTIDAHEVLKAFDLSAAGAVKARWRRFVFLTDAFWAKLSVDDEIRNSGVSFDLTQKLGWFEALGGYRVYERPGGLFGTPAPTEQRIFGVDLLAGLTYSWVDVRLKLSRDPGMIIPAQQRTIRPADDWLAPYLAARLLNDFTPRLRLETLLGLGAFGAGDAPNLAWQVTSQLSYAISEHWFVSAGGRALGFRDDDLDMTFYGPMLGGGFRFGGGR